MLDAVPMCRLELVVLASDEHAVLELLGRVGLVELERAASSAEEATPPTGSSALGQRCAAALGRAERLLAALGLDASDLAPRTEALSIERAEELLARQEPLVLRLEAQRKALGREHEGLTERLARAAPYVELLTTLGSAAASRWVELLLGVLPTAELAKLSHALGRDAVALPLGPRAQPQPIAILSASGSRANLLRRLEQHGFEPRPVPELAAEQAGQARRAALEAELSATSAELARLAAEQGPALAALRGWLQSEQRIAAASSALVHTRCTVLLTGWVPRDAAPTLAEQLHELTAGRLHVALRAPDCDEELIPVLLPHGKLLRPFAPLVTLYGLPRYRELVPTPFVALTYLVMFGMMFGDVGHGAVLLLAGLVLMRWQRLERLRAAAPLVMWAGGASIAFGAVYGSLFGLEPFKRYALWRDPLEGDPSRLMLCAMGLGVVILSLGVVLNATNELRRRHRWEALTAPFGGLGLLFYWGALAALLGGAAGTPLVALLGVPLVVWWLREPLRHALGQRGHGRASGLVAALGEAAVEVFETLLAFLANTISFVRLAAYAMSHAALVTVMLTLGAQAASVPVVGGLLAVLVLVLGHALIMVVEGTIAAVQALRLEYYEFFGKFFAGAGRPFAPFRLAVEGR